MTYCHQNTAVKREGDYQIAVSLPCRSWTCPECAPKRKAQMFKAAEAGRPKLFLTLTCRIRDDWHPDRAALALSRAWRLVRLRLTRTMPGKTFPFYAVMERTKNGWPHLHILLRAKWVPIKQISEWMTELMDSPICWVEHIASRRKCASYISKYCTKDPHRFGTAKRYWSSRDYDLSGYVKLPKNPLDVHSWEFSETPLLHFFYRWLQTTGEVTWDGPHKIVSGSARDPCRAGGQP